MVSLKNLERIILDFLDSENSNLYIICGFRKSLILNKTEAGNLTVRCFSHENTRAILREIPLQSLLEFMKNEIKWDTEFLFGAWKNDTY